MFEVGKKYHFHRDTIGRNYTCVFTDGSASFLKEDNTLDQYSWSRNFSFEQWVEVPPEPNRWSEWRNYCATRLGNTTFFTLEEARKVSRNTTYTIRFDWEQVEGKAKKLLKTELVGVPDA